MSRITEESYFSLGKSYIVYDVEEDTQDKVFYFPIIDEYSRKVVYLIEAIGIEKRYICNTLDNMVDVLNEVNYIDNHCIVYKSEDFIYIETPSEVVNVWGFYNKEACDEYLQVSKDSFAEKSFDNKQELVSDRMNQLEECEKRTWENDREKLNAKAYTSLTLVKPQGQYSYGMCWAAAVATVHNYLCSTVITGFEVCTRMGIGYNDGATIYEIQDALSLYNINYSRVRATYLSWEQMIGNIVSGYPIIAGAFTSNSVGHAVVIYGYSGTSS